MEAHEMLAVITDAVNKKNSTTVAEVVRTGEKLLVPEGMALKDAIEVLDRQQKAEESLMRFQRTFNVFPWEGSMALERAIKDIQGFTTEVAVESWFGTTPPSRISIPVSLTETREIIWGRMQISPDGGWLHTSGVMEDDRVKFQVQGEYRKKHDHLVQKIIAKMQHYIWTEPFYSGRALTMSFREDNGESRAMPSITFYNFDSPEVDALTFSDHIEQLVGANIYAPIVNRAACKLAGIPFKRGVLLAGKYGTGKTLLARKVAKFCVESKTTFIYIKHVAELPEAIQFARQYQPAVIFAEDVDRVVGGQDRTEEIDDVLNTLDGIDSKNTDVMVVLTTNHLENINTAMLRPGRIDVLVEVTPPDAKAALRLVRVYGKGLVEDGELNRLSHELSGLIPAVIREVVERSKLQSIWRTGHAPTAGSISEDDLLGAAASMKQQLDVLNHKTPIVEHPSIVAARVLADGTLKAAQLTADSPRTFSMQ